MTRQARRRWWTKITRDFVLFAVGVSLVIRESIVAGPERPSLYVLYAGMMGLGPVLRYAENRQRRQESER